MNTPRSHGLRAALVSVLLTGSAAAQTIFVDTSNDVVDFGGSQQVADLPGPDGRISLPEAGLASDNTPGVQTIGFHVPQSEWDYQWLYPGRAVLRPFLGFRVFQTAILDATTQTAFSGNTNPDGGGEVVIWHETYLLDNVGGAVLGFDNSSIHVSGGSNNVIQGNTKSNIELYDSSFNLIGGTSFGQGNTCGTIKVDRASNNVVVGNTTTRVRILGWVAGGQTATNNRVGGPTLAERNFITGYGTWSEGCPGGTTVQIFDSTGTVVENNWIGTTPDGLSQGSLASTTGVGLEGENHNTIIRNNRIAGILGHGTGPHCVGWLVGSAIDVYGTGSGVSIVGNAIGLDANNQPLLGSVTGISTTNYYLGPVQNVVIGGSTAGEANEIAGQLGSGISVGNTFSGVRIGGNSIHDNGGLGIDLITSGFLTGVTPNDNLDADTGGNGLQNFPVIQSAIRTGPTLRVVGSLGSSPSTSFTIAFFATPQCDASGYGEGQEFLGATTVSTDSSGDAVFNVNLAASPSVGWSVTATATRAASSSTSEFSACVVVTQGPPSTGTGFCFGDGTGSGCPCGNNGAAGNGCAHSLNAFGANLSGSGLASLANDSLVLAGVGMPNSSALYYQGTAQHNGGIGSLFGDGLRCADGTLIRLGTKTNAAGSSHFPGVGDPSISVRGLVMSPGTRAYQIWYRNAANFCTPSTFNLTNGWSVSWVP
ncbi:MAG: hypothetical protein NTY35_02790 [Planctomycetota bacterium]|nr:hypothetical protein [Planctomycetota bacterium]